MTAKLYKCQRALKLASSISASMTESKAWIEVNNRSTSDLKELIYTFAKFFTKEFSFAPA